MLGVSPLRAINGMGRDRRYGVGPSEHLCVVEAAVIPLPHCPHPTSFNNNQRGGNCNVQPCFVPTDMAWVQQRLSPQHLEYAYCWNTDARGRGGSWRRWRAHRSCNPLRVFMTRSTAKTRRGAFSETECLTFTETLILLLALSPQYPHLHLSYTVLFRVSVSFSSHYHH